MLDRICEARVSVTERLETVHVLDPHDEGEPRPVGN